MAIEIVDLTIKNGGSFQFVMQTFTRPGNWELLDVIFLSSILFANVWWFQEFCQKHLWNQPVAGFVLLKSDTMGFNGGLMVV